MLALMTQTRTVLREIRAAMGRAVRAQGGATAIEFALVAPIFFVLVFAIIEVGLIFATQVVLQNAVNDAAYQVRTGVVQASNMNQNNFNNIICTDISVFVSCKGNSLPGTLRIDLESGDSMQNIIPISQTLNGNDNLNPSLDNYSPGCPGQFVLLRVAYARPLFNPTLTPFLANMNHNNTLIVGVAAFRNEPFPPPTGC